jgi:hypothetical protein
LDSPHIAANDGERKSKRKRSIRSDPPKFTRQALRRILHYNPFTGLWRWRKNIGRAKKGHEAGTYRKDGYKTIEVFNYEFLGHRLAWFYMTNEWPEKGIDHRDTNTSHNCWHNLRKANQHQNSGNQRLAIHNTSELKGVSYDKERAKWGAWIKSDGKSRHLGRFDCPAAAHFAYLIAADEAFGEFARNA